MHALLLGLLLLLVTVLPGQEARWWKGNLHTHSLWSDGDDFPDQIAHRYRERGYAFLAFTEHNVIADRDHWMKVDDIVRRGGRKALAEYRERFGTEWVETRTDQGGKLEVRLKRLDELRGRFQVAGEFILVTAEEITDGFDKRPIHINATGIETTLKPRSGTSIARAIDRDLKMVEELAESSGRGAIAHLNHPNFYFAITAEDLATVLRERFVEVYNGHPGVNHKGDAQHAGNERLWDIASTLRIDRYHAAPPFGLATDDSHSYFVTASSQSNSFRGWVQVRAKELTTAALVAALQTGDFYASSGVELSEVSFEGGTLTVRVSPVAGASYHIEFVGTRTGYDPTATPIVGADGKVIPATWNYSPDVGAVLAQADGTEARYTLSGDELYVRAVVTSTATPENPSFEGQHCQAWTQPVGWRTRVDAQPTNFVPLRCDGEWEEDLRGIAVDPRGAVHWAFGRDLVRTDASGHVESKARSGLPLLDLSLRGDRVVGLAEVDGTAVLRIHDARTLEFVEEVRLPAEAAGARGLAWHAGRLHLVCRTDAGPAFVVLDGSMHTLSRSQLPLEVDIDPRALCFGEHRFWVGGGGSAPGMLVTDASFAPYARVELDVSHGVDALPAGLFLVAATERTDGGTFVGSAWVAEPTLAGGLRHRED